MGLGLEQGAEIEFQPDGEQQQHDAQVGDLLEAVEGGESDEVEAESGCQESDEGRDADFMGEEPERQGGSDGDDDVCHAVLLARPRPGRSRAGASSVSKLLRRGPR